MAVDLMACALELSKIAEAQSKEEASYPRAVVAGLPVVAAQGLADIPESVIERGVQNKILAAGGLPAAGRLLNVGAARFGSRLGAGALTTPLFLSGLRGLKNSKTREDDVKSTGKLLAAGGAYAGLRGALESRLDSKFSHLPVQDVLKRVAGPKALKGIGSAAVVGYTVGKGLKDKGPEKKTLAQNIKPALVGGGLGGLGGLYEGLAAEGFKTPEARWRVGAEVGGKALAGAAASLFLSRLMDRALNGKEKKGSAGPAAPNTVDLYETAGSIFSQASPNALQLFHEDLTSRGPERSPSSRATFYALQDEMRSRNMPVGKESLRDNVIQPRAKTDAVGAFALLAVVAAPEVAWRALNSMEPTSRDRILVDALDSMYIRGKLEWVRDPQVSRGSESAIVGGKIRTGPIVDASTLAHEMGHASASPARASLQGPLTELARTIGSAASVIIPVLTVGALSDPSFSTKEDLEAKATAMNVLGAANLVVNAPHLAEETMAEVSGMRFLRGAGASSGELLSKALRRGVGFASHAAPVAVPFAAASLLRRKVRKAKSSEDSHG